MMLEIEYLTDAHESACATLDFLNSRPLTRAGFFCMQFCCALYALAFLLSMFNHSLRTIDYFVGFFVLTWFFFYKKLTRGLIQRILKVRSQAQVKCHYKIDDKSIMYQLHNLSPQHLEWKKVKYIVRNQHGIIIPMTGIQHAGKFMWLPNRSLPNPAELNNLLTQLQIPVKSTR